MVNATECTETYWLCGECLERHDFEDEAEECCSDNLKEENKIGERGR